MTMLIIGIVLTCSVYGFLIYAMVTAPSRERRALGLLRGIVREIVAEEHWGQTPSDPSAEEVWDEKRRDGCTCTWEESDLYTVIQDIDDNCPKHGQDVEKKKFVGAVNSMVEDLSNYMRSRSDPGKN